MKQIVKTFQFKIKNLHDEEDEDKRSHIGIVEGHISTFDNVDRDGDIFARTAFDRTLRELQSSGKIFLPMLWQHKIDVPIGGFPLKDMHIDDRGLFVKGEINLHTRSGHDTFALLKQGVITEFSIGFIPKERKFEDGNRVFEDVDLMEASLVVIAANPMAIVTNVKTVVPFQNIPIAMLDGEPNVTLRWDSSAALSRVRDFTGSTETPSAKYRTAFLWFDGNASDTFGAYKLPIVDVIGGKLTVIPRAIFAAAAVLQGARGGVDIPDSDRPSVIRNIERYYDKMGLDSPFKKGFGIKEIQCSSIIVIRKMLQNGTHFTKAASDMMSGLEAGRRKSVISIGRDSTGMNHFSQLMNQFKELSNAGFSHKRTYRSDGPGGHNTA